MSQPDGISIHRPFGRRSARTAFQDFLDELLELFLQVLRILPLYAIEVGHVEVHGVLAILAASVDHRNENKHVFEELLKDVSADVVGELPSARREGELSASVSALRVLLGNRLTDRQIDRVADDWRAHGLPADAMARVGEVMANPDTWRNLFGDAEGRARDADQPPPREQSPPKGDE